MRQSAAESGRCALLLNLLHTAVRAATSLRPDTARLGPYPGRSHLPGNKAVQLLLTSASNRNAVLTSAPYLPIPYLHRPVRALMEREFTKSAAGCFQVNV